MVSTMRRSPANGCAPRSRGINPSLPTPGRSRSRRCRRFDRPALGVVTALLWIGSDIAEDIAEDPDYDPEFPEWGNEYVWDILDRILDDATKHDFIANAHAACPIGCKPSRHASRGSIQNHDRTHRTAKSGMDRFGVARGLGRARSVSAPCGRRRRTPPARMRRSPRAVGERDYMLIPLDQ